jgi:hypothetical protein
MRTSRFIPSLASTLLLTSCLGSLEPDIDDIVLDMEVDKTTVSTGESVRVTLTATNQGSKVITLNGPAECLLYFEVYSETSGSPVYRLDNHCSGNVVSEQLAEGETKVQSFVWSARSDAGERVPSGRYAIRGLARLTYSPQAVLIILVE